MYRKLCKYEFKSIARTLLPIYLAVIVVSLINAVSFGMNSLFQSGTMTNAAAMVQGSHAANTMMGLFQMAMFLAYFGVMVALFVLTLIVIIQRFYKGLLCDEGYLMFTLPVKPWQLIASKGTAALVMSIVSVLAGLLSVLILMCGAAGPIEFFSAIFDPRVWSEIMQVMNHAFPKWGLYIPLYFIEGMLLVIVTGMSSLFHMYVSMALGHLARKHRIPMSVLAYLIINMALTFLSGVCVLLADATGLDYMLANLAFDFQMQFVFLGVLLGEGLQLAVFFFGTERILSKKLNLE